ncbi:predicted hydrolase [Paenibacillus popilliae ATCC 14706]|uniref:Predicted hydrolase n=1 Tax=Paenibacillus popilliae ATCC 14706 TaxID=1212764 RepID=M9M4M9_PAEPP|nr:predicted hydrolase [Paenibacillus popilliae ATCC 14706]
MNNKRVNNILWSEVVKLFSEIEDMNLTSFLRRLVEIVKNNQVAINQILNEGQRSSNYKFSENEKSFFRFIPTIDPEMYVIGSTGDSFNLIVESYISRAPKSEFEVLRRISNLVKDIITFTSSVVCPQCNSDHLRILTDIDSKRLYRHCETCSFTDTTTNEEFQNQELLFPANITLLRMSGFIK